MNIFLSADIEGTCGISHWSETDRSAPMDYKPYQRQMTREVCAACEGAIAAGAKDILVRDAHDSARNLDPSALPAQVRFLRGWTGDPLSMMSGLDRGDFDAVFFTGYHAWASCPGSPLSHTMNPRPQQATLNGLPLSEFLMNTYTAWYYGVPVTFLSGDKALCDFAQELIPNLTAVAVNQGLGGGVLSLHPDAAVRAIGEGCKAAAKAGKKCPPALPQQFETAITFRDHKLAYAKSFYPDARLIDGSTVAFAHSDWFELLRFYHFVLSDG